MPRIISPGNAPDQPEPVYRTVCLHCRTLFEYARSKCSTGLREYYRHKRVEEPYLYVECPLCKGHVEIPLP